jgi:hypothetical protein
MCQTLFADGLCESDSCSLVCLRGRCATRATAILPDAKSIPTLFAHAKLRCLLDIDDSAWQPAPFGFF